LIDLPNSRKEHSDSGRYPRKAITRVKDDRDMIEKAPAIFARCQDMMAIAGQFGGDEFMIRAR